MFSLRPKQKLPTVVKSTPTRLLPPSVELLREHDLLDRSQSSYQKIAEKLPPLESILEQPVSDSNVTARELMIFDWLGLLLKNNPDNQQAVNHYALLIWSGSDSNLTVSERNRKALDLLGQVQSDDAFNEYLSAIIQLKSHPDQALYHLTRAANKNYAPAQVTLSRLYLGNEGVPRNDKKARSVLLSLINNTGATKQQRAIARDWLAIMAFYGIGGPRDNKSVLQWITVRDSAVELLYLKALMLSEGIGQSPDIERANQLLELAASAGLVSAANELALNYLLGRGVKRNTQKARDWLEHAVANGSVTAIYNRGIDSLYGYSAPASVSKARAWFHRADDQGLLAASQQLAYLKLRSRSHLPEKHELVEIQRKLEQAAIKGDSWSSYALGTLLLKENKDSDQRLRGYAWLNVAVAQGYQPAAEPRDATALQMSRVELDRAQTLSQTFFDRIHLTGGVSKDEDY